MEEKPFYPTHNKIALWVAYACLIIGAEWRAEQERMKNAGQTDTQ